MKRKRDIEGEILDLGWNTESKSSGMFMAERGGVITGWHASWSGVLSEVKSKMQQANQPHETPGQTS